MKDRDLIDGLGRRVSYLRLSVTDRCDMRCVYCMPEHMSFAERLDVLTLTEFESLASLLVDLGIRKIRVTGGEPLTRRGVGDFITRIGRWLEPSDDGQELDELTLTTNGSLLAGYVDVLWDAGVRRINVSVDSLDPVRFGAITRGGRLERTLEGLQAALERGLAVRLNTVVLLGRNDDELDQLVLWSGSVGADLCLIEAMPMGDVLEDRSTQYVPLSEVRHHLESTWTLEPVSDRTAGPARYVRVAQTGRRLGFITPMTHNFCESCNRVRLTATGTLYTCLGREDQTDLRTLLRSGASRSELVHLIGSALRAKPREHDFKMSRSPGEDLARPMSVTGG